MVTKITFGSIWVTGSLPRSATTVTRFQPVLRDQYMEQVSAHMYFHIYYCQCIWITISKQLGIPDI